MAKTASAVEEEISRDCLNRLGHAGYMLDAAQGSVCIAERRYKKGASCESSISSQTSVLWACGDALFVPRLPYSGADQACLDVFLSASSMGA